MVGIIKDARAGLAVEKSVVGVPLELLDHVRADVNAALATAFAANFREGDAAVALGDAFVVLDEIGGHGRNR